MAMRLYSFRSRRVLSSVFGLHRSFLVPTTVTSSSPTSMFLSLPSSSSSAPAAPTAQFRLFRTSGTSMLSSSSDYSDFKDVDKIDPDTILFEGCDYNHWLITIDFPKDPKPTPEEMVRTYEETCAKGLNISIEEAKKRIYACSTTTYEGFQAVMTEAESEQFRGLPGVVFILPDSYIDPQNKEYGGDKYENGMITPRPPPVQYGRLGGRNRDRNRNYDQPRYGGQAGQGQYRQVNPQHNQQGSMQRDGRSYGAPQQNYTAQQNYPPQQNYPSPPQQNYAAQQNYPPQQNYPSEQGYVQQQHFTPQQNYASPMQGMPMNNRDCGPGGREPHQGNFNPGQQNNYYNQDRRNMPQSDRWNYQPPAQNDFRGGNWNYAPRPTGQYGQGPSGYQNDGNFGEHDHGMGTNYAQGDMDYAGGRGLPQGDQRNMQGDQRSNGPMGHMGTN